MSLSYAKIVFTNIHIHQFINLVTTYTVEKLLNHFENFLDAKGQSTRSIVFTDGVGANDVVKL